MHLKHTYVFNIFSVGPLVRHWTIRYEAKHQYLKALSTSIGNFINITHTLAVRHQSYQCYHLCADDPYELKLEVGQVFSQ